MNAITHIDAIIDAVMDEADLLRITIEDASKRMAAAEKALTAAQTLKAYLQRAGSADDEDEGEPEADDADADGPEPATPPMAVDCELCGDTGEVDDSAGGVGPAAMSKSPCPDCQPQKAEAPAAPQIAEPVETHVISYYGPWPEAFLADCHVEHQAGATLKSIAEKHEVSYPQFTAELKKYRESLPPEPEAEPAPESAPAATVPPTPRPKGFSDPDPDRGASGWPVKHDIDLLEFLGLGWKAGLIAESLECSVDEVKERFALLVPSKSVEDQGTVLTGLRALLQAEEQAA